MYQILKKHDYSTRNNKVKTYFEVIFNILLCRIKYTRNNKVKTYFEVIFNILLCSVVEQVDLTS